MEDQATLSKRIRELAAAKRAVILVHNYQGGPVQEIGDFVGDSLELARQAARTDAALIVFCGVHFMAETAALLSPATPVLLPRLDAGCPMADMVDAPGLAALKAAHPGALVVCYVNSTAAVKALSDVCCTSANAPRVVAALPADREIIFVPDRYLGEHVQRQTGRELILWPGYCPIHAALTGDDVAAARRRFPGAEIWAHPECRPEVATAADLVLSTGQMTRRAAETRATTVVVGTERTMLYRLRREHPALRFEPLREQAVCVNMKKTGLGDVLAALEHEAPVVRVDEATAAAARRALTRMLELS